MWSVSELTLLWPGHWPLQPPETPYNLNYSIVPQSGNPDVPEAYIARHRASGCSSALRKSAIFLTCVILLEFILILNTLLLQLSGRTLKGNWSSPWGTLSFKSSVWIWDSWYVSLSEPSAWLGMPYASCKNTEKDMSVPFHLTKSVERLLQVLKYLLASKLCFPRENFPVKYIIHRSSNAHLNFEPLGIVKLHY